MHMLSKRANGVLLLLFSLASAQKVEFFYSPLFDSCEWGASNILDASSNTVNGGLCAYVPSGNRLYACPAPDPTCWTWYETCKGGTNTPSSDQILCGASTGVQWCCTNYETCTETENQINVCTSEFASPNYGVTPAEAVLKEYKAIPSSGIGTVIPSATPTAFSTQLFGSSTSTSSSSSSSSSSTSASSTGSSLPSADAANGSPQSPPTPTPTAPSSPSGPSISTLSAGGLSGGSIAGIVVGSLAGIVTLAGIAIFIFLRRRRQAADKVFEADGQEKSDIGNSTGYYGDAPKGPLIEADTGRRGPQELPVPVTRLELPG